MTDVIRAYRAEEFSVGRLRSLKGERTVSVCVPARDEARTVGRVVGAVAGAHLAARGGSGLVDELVVVDDGSQDGTGMVAADAGARVLRRATDPGKGQAMRAGLAETTGDLVVFLDADVEDVTGAFVHGLLGPLLVDPDVALVKAYYDRPLNGAPTGGGRVTELVARPAIELLFPELAAVRQPLAGETAGWRWALEKTSFDDGYGVELGLLIDVAGELGTRAIAQVDLGVRTHRNRSLAELRPQAVDVLRAALRRAPSMER